MTIVLDTWALLAHLRDEPAAARVREGWLDVGAAMCSVNLGEALYLEMRARGAGGAGDAIERARRELTVIDPDWNSSPLRPKSGRAAASPAPMRSASRLRGA